MILRCVGGNCFKNKSLNHNSGVTARQDSTVCEESIWVSAKLNIMLATLSNL